MIRYALKKDVNDAFRLINILNSDKYTFEDFKIAYDFNLKNAHVLLFERNAQIIGLAVLSIVYPLHHSKKIAEVLELVVDDAATGQGIGRSLIEKLECIARKNKCTGIEVASNQIRKDAHRFYERENYENTHFKLTKKL